MKVLLAKSAVKQTLYLLPLKMNSVFKYYNVCDDVAEIISKKLHCSMQNEINDHISVMINYDDKFNYWKISNNSEDLFKSFRHIYDNNVDFKKTIEVFNYLKDNKNYSSNDKISDEDYIYYLKSNKKIFNLNDINRITIINKNLKKSINKFMCIYFLHLITYGNCVEEKISGSNKNLWMSMCKQELWDVILKETDFSKKFEVKNKNF